MTTDSHNSDAFKVNIGGALFDWYWSVPWLAEQHQDVPLGAILQGVNALNLQPHHIADGRPVYSAHDYARLQQWLVEVAGAELKGHSEAVN